MFHRHLFATALAILALAPGVHAHEFWLEPEAYRVAPGDSVALHLRNGEVFKGPSLGWFDNRIARFEAFGPDGSAPLAGRMGDRPAAVWTAPEEDGLAVIIHETRESTLTYKEWDKFARFAAHKDFPDIEARHQARGLPREGFDESYWRYAKTLIGVGTAEGSDRETGMETEFVALTNPYAGPLDAMRLRLLYQGAPRGDAQVEVFARRPGEEAVVTLLRTDAAGEVEVPVAPGMEYLIDAVVLRAPPEGAVSAWETHWAALTFAIPG